MARTRIAKNSFSGGEISPYLIGRGDLKAYENGMASMRNLIIYSTGGLRRRAGLRHVDTALGPSRLVAFEFNIEQAYLLVFSDLKMQVYRDGVKEIEIDTPWSESQLPLLVWTQSADTLLVVHPDIEPQKITRTSHTDWTIVPWSFYEDDETGRRYAPFYKFSVDDVTLQASATTGTVTLTASADVFVDDHINTRMRLAKKEVEITAVTSPTQATAMVKEKDGLVDIEATKDWEEQSFSKVHGWPVSVVFHQDRLVIGGTRDLPNRLWMSKSSDLFNFDLGEGLDDEAIEFAILSDQVNAIRSLFSSRHLQIFTSGAEWMVSGDPLTPETIQLKRQTRVGTPIDRYVPPRNVDGATLFVSRDGQDLREFMFADMEQAYQSNDLAMLSKHIMNEPQDQDYDSYRRQFYMVMGDGTMGALSVYRAEKISAWSVFETQGSFKNICVVAQDAYVLVERNGQDYIEVFDDRLSTDGALYGEDEDGSLIWSGLDHIEGQNVKVIADGAVAQDQQVTNGQLILNREANALEAGLAYTHVLEPLPPSPQTTGNAAQGGRIRLVSLTFRLKETMAFKLDVGRGPKDVPFKRFGASGVLDSAPQSFTGDITVRALGWRRNGTESLWRIEQDTPLPFSVMSVLVELTANA
ncbi:conserved hypothetical protein [Candidatus Terasakiella magnetica]|uniref:Phage protein n=1 Tax=Candidatus Terasakiella magnetica TaxID=1867952 RepID=A0A1C3RDN2_9PROT|nr:hypothetical protein [Candidatus Terasakiella magnetica]SCA55400.1 conserved hypothetical protein [Candidatus Terasakiella magnetica]